MLGCFLPNPTYSHQIDDHWNRKHNLIVITYRWPIYASSFLLITTIMEVNAYKKIKHLEEDCNTLEIHFCYAIACLS